jgi:predicted  nucleic acid-binding Zn-ribbon protein
MSPLRYRTFVVVLLCVVLGVTAFDRPTRAQQSAPSSNDVMTALLQEVHGLRLAMEQSAALAPRVQLTLARLNIEEQRIAHLAAQFDRARQDLTNTSFSIRNMTDEVENLEKQLQTATDDKRRREFEMMIADNKTRLKVQAAAEDVARARENEAMQALSTEQNRWIELNARLDELERSLAPIR